MYNRMKDFKSNNPIKNPAFWAGFLRQQKDLLDAVHPLDNELLNG